MTTRQLKIGETIVGEFKIRNIFGGEGKSGMGVVYLVSNRNYPNPFVLKHFRKLNLIRLKGFVQKQKLGFPSAYTLTL